MARLLFYAYIRYTIGTMDQKLVQSILQTLAYFDVFSYPLTSEELYRLLWKAPRGLSYADFFAAMHEYSGDAFCQTNGFWHLPGRGYIVADRQRRIVTIEEKMNIAQHGIRKLSRIPFVRAVFVCNTVASGNPREESDIDVFIITRPKHIWLVRFFATVILKLFRLRTAKDHMNNRICLSFYMSDNRLNMKDLRLDDEDIYLVYWLGFLIPVYDPDDLLTSIQRANEWVQDYAPHVFEPYIVIDEWRVSAHHKKHSIKQFFEKIWSTPIGDMLEQTAKQIQMPKIERHYGTVSHADDTRVIIEDDILKFHENDRRKEYRERWMDKCKEII